MSYKGAWLMMQPRKNAAHFTEFGSARAFGTSPPRSPWRHSLVEIIRWSMLSPWSVRKQSWWLRVKERSVPVTKPQCKRWYVRKLLDVAPAVPNCLTGVDIPATPCTRPVMPAALMGSSHTSLSSGTRSTRSMPFPSEGSLSARVSMPPDRGCYE